MSLDKPQIYQDNGSLIKVFTRTHIITFNEEQHSEIILFNDTTGMTQSDLICCYFVCTSFLSQFLHIIHNLPEIVLEER